MKVKTVVERSKMGFNKAKTRTKAKVDRVREMDYVSHIIKIS